MIKKLCISLLLSLKIAGSDSDSSDSSNCLTCYASSCLLGFSATAAAVAKISAADLCLYGSTLACSTAAYKVGECCHQQCVNNFDPNNSVDTTCAKVSGIIAAKYCLDCTVYGQCPTCLPLVCLILSHNGLKIAQESMTDSFSAPYNQQICKLPTMKND